MKEYIKLVRDVASSARPRQTRSGLVHSVFDRNISFDMRDGFPLVTTKKMAWNAMVGELLWFLNGEQQLAELRHRSDLKDDAWTIWTDDCKRWHQTNSWTHLDHDELGDIYGCQWRAWMGNDEYHDQIQALVEKMKSDPMSRYMIVSAWNVADIMEDRMALPPCHMMFQVYVEDEWFDLKWTQRSVDLALGLPFNIASYGLLMLILGQLTGLRPRYLSASLGDVHIYHDHLDALRKQADREPLVRPGVIMPDIHDLRDLQEMTAKDFPLFAYTHHEPIKFELSVG